MYVCMRVYEGVCVLACVGVYVWLPGKEIGE